MEKYFEYVEETLERVGRIFDWTLAALIFIGVVLLFIKAGAYVAGVLS